MYKWNNNLSGVKCIRCSSSFNVADYFKGCPNCYKEGHPASLSPIYSNKKITFQNKQKGLKKYVEHLPYLTFPTLGEGSTPIIELKRFSEQIGVDRIWVKNEGVNPTGSHKDRMSPFIAARAKSEGYTTVVVASTGNAGLSTASYCALAGLKCTIITTSSIPPTFEKAIRTVGAELIYTKTVKDRWNYLEKYVRENEWYPATNHITPPVGSNFFGVEGYKTIAYEIIEELNNNLPTILVIPSSRGDLFWGIYSGFKEAKMSGLIYEIPKLVAVEPYPRVSCVLNGEDYRGNFSGESRGLISISGTTVTYQLYKAIKETKGSVKVVDYNQAKQGKIEMGKYGLYLEMSSATVWSAIEQLKNEITNKDRILAIATSHGFKDFSE